MILSIVLALYGYISFVLCYACCSNTLINCDNTENTKVIFPFIKSRSEEHMAQTIFQVDAFTDKPFAGNPAGVCILSEPREEGWMQNVAREMNLSETAFLLKEQDGFNLRWFTPAVEVDLCGHATLASAHILWEEGYLKPEEQARFNTRSGLLTAERQDDWIEMNFPATPEG